MLVLGRELGEVIVLSDDRGEIARFVVTEFRPHRIRLGFDAPPEVRIMRLEVEDPAEAERIKAMYAARWGGAK